MARPGKQGMDYFPLDCILDTKFRLIEADFGLKGFAVIIKLYQKIYVENGYYCKWTKDSALLFAGEINEKYSLVDEIVKSALKREIFNRKLFNEYEILTSKGIQERYIEAAARRKKIKMIKEYLLINVKENKNVDSNSINVDNNLINVDINPQSKVKENKVKENKVNNNGAADAESLFNLFWNAYPKKKAKTAARKAFDRIKPDRDLVKIMISVIENEKLMPNWNKDNGRFIPYPATWLNQRRWEDEPTEIMKGCENDGSRNNTKNTESNSADSSEDDRRFGLFF